MPPVNGFQLSPIQQGMLYHHLRAPQAGVDIEQMTVRLRDGVDPKALRRAWELLVNAHAAFRSSFLWNDLPEPLQVEHPKIDLEWLERDLGGLAPDARASAIEEFLDADRRRGFDLSVPPLTRCALFRLDGKEWEFVWTFHHISADGQAYPALVREGFAAYEAIRDGRQPQFAKPPAMRDFVAWRARHWAEIRDRAEPFWRETLKGFASPTALPGSGTAKRDAAGQGMRSVALSETETAKLRAFAEAQGCTLNTLVQAAWAFLLAAYSNEDDVVFGETRACRRNTVPGAENIVGTLINTVPIRIRLNHNMRLCDWLKDLRAARSALRAFEHTPLSEIQHWSELPAKTALFDSIIVFTPRLIGAALREQGGTWAERDIEFREQTNYPLTLFAYGEGGLLLRLAYDRAQIADATAARCVEQLGTLLRGMPENSDRLLSDISLVGPDERRRLTVEWNDTARPYPMDRTIHELFEDQVARTPDAVAVAFRDQSLTYGELNECANRLAHRLQSLGAGPGKIVGIFMKRSIDLVVALLGTLKSGAAYLPLDPAFPRERISWMLEDTRAPIVVTQRGLKDAVPASAGTHILCLDDPASLDGAASSGNIARAAGPQDLAYVIFTSGSSGRPKGVMIEHRNVVNFFAGMDDSLEYREPGTWLAVTSISFDISVLELFWTLTRGFKVVVQEEAWLEGSSAGTAAAGGSGMQFSLFYFAADAGESGDNKYRLLLEGSQFADRNGFAAVWTPERHFHAFGGLYPNPSLTGAAIAATTKNVQIRAGSVVLPLHNPIRIAEEWSVVDNLSGGRVGLSFASGWHANDFALMPQNYRERKEITFRGIETVKKLWSGESVKVQSGTGAEIDVRIFPAPVQRDPPIWVTAAGSVETFRMAGELGANLLTNLLGQKAEDLTAKIAAYRAARRERGHAGEGTVTLMLHTFVGPDMDMVRQIVRRPFIEYLKTSTDLIKQARWEFPAFANAKGAKLEAPEGGELSPDEVDALMEHAFERYFQTSGLFGTPDVCLAMVDR
ncbi:MAG TPA: MupA/Atu3671 family FMN-dependent luciferase-like monooxygenase, partial [Candidatus Cybelea sp.]|nr:MupA/Atu3671 family FMN-dependent luciferase-like monooxygenase [Candidatus Cybelea sp.]